MVINRMYKNRKEFVTRRPYTRRPPPMTAVNPAVAFTTPRSYADRLSHLLTLKSLTPIWCPTITTQSTPQTLSSLSLHLSPQSLSLLSAIAFPSRSAISATSTALSRLTTTSSLIPSTCDPFILAALGKDAELLDTNFLLKFCGNNICNLNRVRVLVPEIATPSGLVTSLGAGQGRRVLCPVPKVVGLEEPPVVPNFLRELENNGWVPIRVNAYETRWLGLTCVEEIVNKEGLVLGAIVFTSTGEVEGFVKSMKEYGWDWRDVRTKWPGLVVAAHGPVTAEGAEKLGVDVDVVSDKFGSFEGVVEFVDMRIRG